MWFEIYNTIGLYHQWRWRLKSSNGKILADSGEAYSSRSGARRAARRIFSEFRGSPYAMPEIRDVD